MTAGDGVGGDAGNDARDWDNGHNHTSNNASKGDGTDTGREGGGLLAENPAALVVAPAAVAAVEAAAYCRGRLLFIVKIFLYGIFMMCGGNWRGHTSPHTLIMLEVCRRTFGWGW